MTAIDFNGATVVVTGASRGFGRATAVALAESGVQVVGVARHRGGLEELQRELGDALNCETGDVTDPELPARLFGTYRPPAVVLNAGATPVIAPLDEHDWDTFSVNWNVDVRQAFHFVQQALRTPPPNGGVVVTMSSGAALGGSPMSGGHAGAKATVCGSSAPTPPTRRRDARSRCALCLSCRTSPTSGQAASQYVPTRRGPVSPRRSSSSAPTRPPRPTRSPGTWSTSSPTGRTRRRRTT